MKINLGAYLKNTNKYISPIYANKKDEFQCIECGNKVILRKGDIRRPHFSHINQDDSCKYFNNHGESQVHREAKSLIAFILREKRQLCISWSCSYPKYYKIQCGYNFINDWDQPIIDYKEGDSVIEEYRDPDGGKWIADVAVVNNGNIRLIIEIKATHSTNTDVRPEPWYELDAHEVIETVTDMHANGFTDYGFRCLRRDKDGKCYGSFCFREEWADVIPKYDIINIDNKCTICGIESYVPIGSEKYTRYKICLKCAMDDVINKSIKNKFIPVYEYNKKVKKMEEYLLKEKNRCLGRKN